MVGRRSLVLLGVLALTFGWSAGAASVAAAPKDKTPPTTPTNLRITASTATSVTLEWNAATDNQSNWWYCVQNMGAGCIRVDPPTTRLVRTNLLPDRTFSWSVYAIDASGNRSGNSNTVTFTTPPDTTPPSPPPVLSVGSVYPTRIGVAWTASTDDRGGQVWYRLYLDGSPITGELLGWRSALIPYIEPGSTHTFRVTARDAYFNVTTSNDLTVTTPEATDFTPPTAPTNLRHRFQSDPPEAWLEWTESTDDTDPRSLIMYEVYLNGVFSEIGIIGYHQTITYCREPGPTLITLRAVDTSGNRSGPSNALPFDC